MASTIRVNIDGDASGLNQAFAKASRSARDFGNDVQASTSRSGGQVGKAFGKTGGAASGILDLGSALEQAGVPLGKFGKDLVNLAGVLATIAPLALTMGPAGPFVLGAVAIAGGIIIVIKNLDTLKKKIGEVRDFAVTAFQDIRNAIVGAFQDAVNKVIDLVNKAIAAYNKIPIVPDIKPVAHVGPGPTQGFGGKVPKVAGGHEHGSRYFSGGLTLVGEGGPELVSLPRGSQIMNNRQTRRFGRGQTGQLFGDVHIHDRTDIEVLAGRVSRALAFSR